MGCLGRDVQGTVGKAWEAVATFTELFSERPLRLMFFPSSSLIFVLYSESWVREEAGES